MTSLTELLSQYDVLKILVSHAYAADVLNLANTCQAAREYIRGNDTRLDNMLTLSIGCKGTGRRLWLERQAEVEDKLDAQRRDERAYVPDMPERGAEKRTENLRQRIALYTCDSETIKKQCTACGEAVCNVWYSPINLRGRL